MWHTPLFNLIIGIVIFNLPIADLTFEDVWLSHWHQVDSFAIHISCMTSCFISRLSMLNVTHNQVQFLNFLPNLWCIHPCHHSQKELALGSKSQRNLVEEIKNLAIYLFWWFAGTYCQMALPEKKIIIKRKKKKKKKILKIWWFWHLF